MTVVKSKFYRTGEIAGEGFFLYYAGMCLRAGHTNIRPGVYFHLLLTWLQLFSIWRLPHSSRKEEAYRQLLGRSTISKCFTLTAGSSDWRLDWQRPLSSSPNSHICSTLLFNHEQSAVLPQKYLAALNCFFLTPQFIKAKRSITQPFCDWLVQYSFIG